jgi:hypothetical protein
MEEIDDSYHKTGHGDPCMQLLILSLEEFALYRKTALGR